MINEEEILGEEEIFEESMMNESTSPEDLFFQQTVMALQQIIIDEEFEKAQAGFMRLHCSTFEFHEENKIQYTQIFHQYQYNMNHYLENKLTQMVNNFTMQKFTALLQSRANQIDQQIYEILISLSDFEVFKQMMLDYRTSQEQEQRYRILTIKSSKMPETKKVKSNAQNIFANPNTMSLGNQGLKKKSNNAPKKKQKTEDELLVPEMVLTVRPLRKG